MNMPVSTRLAEELSLPDTLDRALQLTDELLDEFVNRQDSIADLQLSFGSEITIEALQSLIPTRFSQSSSFPAVELRSQTELNGAKGAFSVTSNTIYLSDSFVAQNRSNPAAIASVLLEEIGHFVDSQINAVDTPGDEGAIFSARVQKQTLTPLQLEFLKSEDDRATVLLGGKSVSIEQATEYQGTNLADVKAGLDKFFTSLQQAVNSQVLGNGLPLVGNSLQSSANDALQFINKLKKAVDDELAKLPSTATPEDLEKALTDAASKLGVFKDLKRIVDTTDNLEFSLNLEQASVNFSTPLQSNIGLPNLGLQVKGNADAQLGYSFNLNFGLDKTNGFFVDTSIANPLKLNLGITTPGLDPKLNLGFLQFDAKDKGTQFNGEFSVNLKDVNADNKLFPLELETIGSDFSKLVDARLKGNADVELKLGASTGVKGLPAIGTDFSLKWNFNGGTLLDPTKPTSFGEAPQIKFSNTVLDLGSVINDFVGPILTDIKKVTGPLNDVAKELTDPLPVIGSSIIDLAPYAIKAFGGSVEGIEFLKQLLGVIKLADEVSKISTSDGLKLDLGDFDLGSADVRSTPTSSATAISTRSTDPKSQLTTAATGGSQSASLIQQLQNSKGDKEAPTFKLNLLDDPSQYAFGLLLGKDVGDILTFTPPPLSLYFKFDPPAIPVFGPIVLKFGGIAGVGAGIKIGYDTKGLADFAKGADGTLGTGDDFSNPGSIFDGFYASKPDAASSDILKPSDFLKAPFAPTGHNLSLLGELDASAGVGIGIADITVGGGLRFTSNLDLVGKVRASTIDSTPPLCLFNSNGKLSAIIFGQIELDFGFFSFTQRIDLADIDLIDYSTGCDSSEPHYNVADPGHDPETQQQLAAQGIIDRKGTSGNDIITFTKSGGGKGDETLTLVGLVPETGETNNYEHVKLVVINGGDGNDTIDLTGILAPGQLKGGAGNDTLIGSDGGSNFLTGGLGNDILKGGKGTNNTVDYASSPKGTNTIQGYSTSNGGGAYVNLLSNVALDGFGGTDSLDNIQNAIGSAGNDTLIASNLNAFLNSGDGDDILQGGTRDDVLLGGSGADDMDGGGGTNTTTYLTSQAPVYVNLSSFNVGDETPVYLPIDLSPLYLAAQAAYGGDADGDRLRNIQNIQGSVYDDILVAGDASTLKSANGYSFTGSYVDGSDGNDVIYSEAGSDVLDGGRGINWLSYALSVSGVNVSLKPTTDIFGRFFAPIGSGGFAQGDRILPSKNEYNDNKGIFTNLSSFRNLEGSNAADTLSGDDGNNVIRGLAGNDTINGNGGNDILIGGAGADSLIGGGFSGTLRADLSASSVASGGLGGDTASYVDSPGRVFVNLGANFGLLNDALGDTFIGVQNLIGSEYNDVLIGSAQDNDINPGLSNGGTDFVDGAGGTNSLTLDYSLGDYGRGVTGGFTNTSSSSGSFSRLSTDGTRTLDAVSFSNIQRLYAIATSRNDSIIGGTNGKGDVIFAEAGDDFVNGGSGIDYLDGGDGIDTLSEDLSTKIGLGDIFLFGTDPIAPKQFNDTNVSLSDGTQIANFEIFKDIKTANGNDALYQPGRVDNTFSTGAGNDFVNPGIGFDTVDSGSGDDLLILDYSQGDTGGRMQMFVDPREQTGIAYRRTTDLFFGEILPPLLDRINFSNFERYFITGTSKGDLLESGDGNDYLFGEAGNDTLFGSRGNDYLSGGDDNDVLQGTNNTDYGYDIPPNPSSFFQIPTHVFNLPKDIDYLAGGRGADTFVLGADSNSTYINQVFYANAVNSGQQVVNSGISDYAVITDFNPTEGDTIRLHDMRPCNGYSLKATPSGVPSGTGLFFNQDLIAVIQGSFKTPLDLNASYFQYVGLPCPPPVIIY